MNRSRARVGTSMRQPQPPARARPRGGRARPGVDADVFDELNDEHHVGFLRERSDRRLVRPQSGQPDEVMHGCPRSGIHRVDVGEPGPAVGNCGGRNSQVGRAALLNTKLLRRLANAHAAAKGDASPCPASDRFDACAERRRALTIAVAAVDEFTSSDHTSPGPNTVQPTVRRRVPVATNRWPPETPAVTVRQYRLRTQPRYFRSRRLGLPDAFGSQESCEARRPRPHRWHGPFVGGSGEDVLADDDAQQHHWRNVWLIHETSTTGSPDEIADGSETIAAQRTRTHTTSCRRPL